jgi:hypothetical protein
MKKLLIGAFVGAAALAGAAQAQTVSSAFYEANIAVPMGNNTANDFSAPITFNVPTAETFLIQGTAISNPSISGIISLVDTTNNSVVWNSIPVTDGAVHNPYFNNTTLAAGNYEVLYSFSNTSAMLPDTVTIDGELVAPVSASAPEIDPASAASGLTLLAGALLVLRGRRRTVPVATFA